MSYLHDEKIKFLEQKAREIRVSTIESLIEAGSGHTAGPLGMADVFTTLFFHTLKHNPKRPDWKERDLLVLSNGHICPVYYATLAHAGYFPIEELKTLRKFGSRLQGHPHRDFLPFLETSSGPLGSGLSQAIGMALALRIDAGEGMRGPVSGGVNFDSHRYIYCLMSDGEHDEGNTWEGIMLAAKYKVHNLIAIVDRNNIQIDGNTEDVMPLEPLADKWRAFGWHVQEVDGHNYYDINMAVDRAKAVFEKPSVVIAYTISGKGVQEIEGDYRWHGVPPGKGPENVWKKEDQGPAMLRELRTLSGKIRAEHH
ncbi:MAG: transketolase [Parcubacteria group bacterium RIFCSPHIGHO2_01_FULL_45_26]|nr:MAG: transketolase [Parcubacteria group bacterium RIFCSPHIGHO2_01_FULL_45_26]